MNEHSNNNNAGNPSVRKVPALMIRENDNDRGEDDDNDAMVIDLKRNKRKKKDNGSMQYEECIVLIIPL